MYPVVVAIFIQVFIGCLFISLSTAQKPSDYVNVFIGTGGEGFGIGSTPPGPQVPFGMVRLGPDTVAFDDIFLPFNHFGGYYHGDGHIRCFSHTHMVGSGVLDYGTIAVMPVSQNPTSKLVTSFGYRSSFSHDSEKGTRPGYYRAHLDDWHILAELTATSHVGVHRYTYTKGGSPIVILFDISYTLTQNGCGNATIEIDQQNNEIRGSILNMGTLASRGGGVWNYFVAKFSAPFSSFGVWNIHKQILEGTTSTAGCGSGGYVSFGTSNGNTVVEAYVGVSFVSIDQARANLNAEVKSTQKFQDIMLQTQNLWDQSLNRIQIKGGTDDQKSVFYTSLYHTLLAPTQFNEVGGYYVGFDYKVHQVDKGMKNYYSDMSIWDTHRTEFPWLTFFQPDVMSDIIKSLLVMYQQGGDIPRWPLANVYTGCMIGQHADISILDAYVKGVTDFDVKLAYQGMKQGATQIQKHASRCCIGAWETIGYVPYEQDSHSCPETLEYSYDDWAVGTMAKLLGNSNDANTFLNRSKNYKNNWNDKEKFFCPKTSSGEWNCPTIYIDPFDSRYVEGDAWQWRWFVPHDIPGMIELFGSNDYFVDQLEEFFERSWLDPFNILPNPYYWAGNEPDILAPYLFDWAGRPDLTQYYTRKLMRTYYINAPNGIPGNDDYGTMSAWAIFTSLGFYPLAGSTTYMIGSPLFDSVSIQMPQGTTLTINVYNNSNNNVYVQQVKLNGQPLTSPFLDHSQLINGNVTLEFWMSSNPTINYVK